MMTEVCQYLRNWFEKDKLQGTFTITNEGIAYSDGSALPIVNGQYFRVVNSALNDGVYKYGEDTLIPEEFEGAVWVMAVPPSVAALVDEISAWQNKYGGVDSEAMSPFLSESFNHYSYSKGSAYSGSSSDSGWKLAFGSRLSPWRKI